MPDPVNEDEILSLGPLSDTEREALIEAGVLKAGPGDETPATEQDEDDAPAGDEADADADDKGVAATDDKPADEDPLGILAKTDAPAAEDPFIPEFKADPVRMDEITTRLTAIETERAALRSSLQQGDIDADEYAEKSERLSDERGDLKAEQLAAQAQEDASERAQAQAWARDQKRFFDASANAIFAREKDPVMYEALNAQVKILAADPEKAALSGRQVLDEAARLVRERFNLGTDKPAADPKKAAAELAAKRAKAQADRQAGVPHTLGTVPAAAEHDDVAGDDEFGDIDTMLGSQNAEDQMRAEAMIARMSQDQRRRFGVV